LSDASFPLTQEVRPTLMLLELAVGHKEFTELLTFTGIKWHLHHSKCQENRSVRVYDVNMYTLIRDE